MYYLFNERNHCQTVLFRPSGPHQCSADAGVEVSGYIATSDDPTHVISSYHVRVLKLVN